MNDQTTAAGLAEVVRNALAMQWTAMQRRNVIAALESALDDERRRRVRERPHARDGDPPEGK